MVNMPESLNRSTLRVLFFVILVSVIGVSVFLWTQQKSDQQFLESCQKFDDEEAWQELKNEASLWIAQADQPDEALTFMAEAEYQLGRPEEAVKHLLQVPRGSKRRFRSFIAASGIQFSELNQPLAGIETLKRMIKMRPSSTTSHQRLIFFYAVTLQRELMLAAIEDAIASNAEPPDAYVYLLLAGKLSFSNGFAKNSEWLRSDPKSELFRAARIIQLLDSVKTSESQQRQRATQEYWKVFHDLRDEYPQNIVLAIYEIEQAAEEFDLDRVRSLMDEIPESRLDPVLLKWKGWLELESSQPQIAEGLLLRSIEGFRLDWRVWHDLASCRRRLGDLNGAEQAEQIARVGKELRKEVLQLKNAALIESKTLEKLASYAASCGDNRIALAILKRLRRGQRPKSAA